MRLVIVTGMSGAGKTTALKILEDMGYYCVDNLPVLLVTNFLELIPQHAAMEVALGIDIRSGQMLEELQHVLEELVSKNIQYEILYLNANDNCLIKRYKETRRNHPLSPDGRVENGIAKEREALAFLLSQADYVIGTDHLLTRELRAQLEKIFRDGTSFQNLNISIVSFGFKYGIPVDCDLVFDVRFLPNPYYIEELRPLTGEDLRIKEYVEASGVADVFQDKLDNLLCFLLPNYIEEGRSQLVIGIGCTGGKHRSVVMVNALYARLAADERYGVRVEHRDIMKG